MGAQTNLTPQQTTYRTKKLAHHLTPRPDIPGLLKRVNQRAHPRSHHQSTISQMLTPNPCHRTVPGGTGGSIR
eukprot:scaffold108109_cov44-Tisochrysis_lutea.AAC.1